MYCKIMKVDCPHAGQIQLNGYMDFIESKTNKKVEAYLYSINKNEFKEVRRIHE